MSIRTKFVIATLIATLSAPAAAWAYTTTSSTVEGTGNGFADPDAALEGQSDASQDTRAAQAQWFGSETDAGISGRSFATPGDRQGSGAQGWGSFSSVPDQPPQH